MSDTERTDMLPFLSLVSSGGDRNVVSLSVLKKDTLTVSVRFVDRMGVVLCSSTPQTEGLEQVWRGECAFMASHQAPLRWRRELRQGERLRHKERGREDSLGRYSS